MSYLVVQYQKSIGTDEIEKLLNSEHELVELTARLFGKKSEEIIVDYVPFSTYSGKRKILVRAETSMKNILLLEEWAKEIKAVFQGKVRDFGVKTYVEESRWVEEDK